MQRHRRLVEKSKLDPRTARSGIVLGAGRWPVPGVVGEGGVRKPRSRRRGQGAIQNSERVWEKWGMGKGVRLADGRGFLMTRLLPNSLPESLSTSPPKTLYIYCDDLIRQPIVKSLVFPEICHNL